MIGKLFFHILSGIIGIYIAAKFFALIQFSGSVEILILAGLLLGLANFFIKPVLKLLSFPVIILTLGLFSLVINMFLVWLILDVMFPNHLEINGIIPLFWTTIIIWLLNMIFIAQKPKHIIK